MKEVEVFSAASASTSIDSVGFFLGDLNTYSVHITFSSSTLNGTLYLQASNDNSDWPNISESQQSIVSGTSHLYSVQNAAYKYVRVSWTRTSGTGTITAKLVAKELQIKAQ